MILGLIMFVSFADSLACSGIFDGTERYQLPTVWYSLVPMSSGEGHGGEIDVETPPRDAPQRSRSTRIAM